MKAKLVLSAVAMMALVGGALAFKASRVPTILYQVDATNPITSLRICTKPTTVLYSTAPTFQGQAAVTSLPYYTTTFNSTKCPTVSLYTAL